MMHVSLVALREDGVVGWSNLSSVYVAYVSIRQLTSAYVARLTCCFGESALCRHLVVIEP